MISLPDTVIKTIETFRQNGFECYVVGGSIRNILMGLSSGDWDFTTNALPEQILSLFPDSFYDNQFGTVGIKIYDQTKPIQTNGEPIVKEIYEVTTYRSEQGYSDSRHPDSITWGKSITEDLARRDFTINAMAYDGTTLLDPYNAMEDIRNKIIRTVGNPIERFSEDSLRMMRAIRIASQLQFSIEPNTISAIRELAKKITYISNERVRDELFKIFASEFPADGIIILRNTTLLESILPELAACFTVEQKSPKRHHIYDVGTHSVKALASCPSTDPVVRLATLLHDIGKPATQKITDDGVVTFYNHEIVSAKLAKGIAVRLRLSKKDTDLLYRLVRWHQFSVDERQTDSAIRRIIRHVGKESMNDMLALRIGDRLGGGALESSWRLELFKKRILEVQKQPFTVADLAINGHDIMKKFSIPPSKAVGDILQSLFLDVENNAIKNERDVLLSRLDALKKSQNTQ